MSLLASRSLTLGELIQQTQGLPDNTPIVTACEHDSSIPAAHTLYATDIITEFHNETTIFLMGKQREQLCDLETFYGD